MRSEYLANQHLSLSKRPVTDGYKAKDKQKTIRQEESLLKSVLIVASIGVFWGMFLGYVI